MKGLVVVGGCFGRMCCEAANCGGGGAITDARSNDSEMWLTWRSSRFGSSPAMLGITSRRSDGATFVVIINWHILKYIIKKFMLKNNKTVRL